jgi:hypothetical protein
MATQNIRLTPHTDQTPAVVEVPRELSGPHWCGRFLGSAEISQLRPRFQLPVSKFVWAMEKAGATVRVNATYRPKERAYLMHWAFMIWHENHNPDSIPEMDNVLIDWSHSTRHASKDAAHKMASEYAITHLGEPPALATLHTIREAIDMTISWNGTLKILNNEDEIVEITSTPRTGMNADLKAVGATYGVMKFVGGESDRPHWSTTGH